ncbi:MAG: hypothetical protein ACMUIM_04230 [bacterium]
MSCKKTFKSLIFSLITLLGLLLLSYSFSYAQYNPYLSYSYGGTSPGLYSVNGIYDGLSGITAPYLLIGNSYSIYSELGYPGAPVGLSILNPYSLTGGLADVYGQAGNFNLIGEIPSYLRTGMMSPYTMLCGTIATNGNQCSTTTLGRTVGLSGMGSAILGILPGLGGSAEIVSLGGLGSLAGLASLGSKAGLITGNTP